ncbi:MAG: FAD-binding oxidoreductase, partial [Rhizobium pusense]|nr:FAD-binding oxidoreductase [Agrobacterium pusense]
MTDNSISSAVIIGAGIFGVSTGVQLARRGIQVTILNDGPPANGASGRSLSWLNSARAIAISRRERSAAVEFSED